MKRVYITMVPLHPSLGLVLLFFDDHYPRVNDTRTLGEEAVLRHNTL